MNVVRTIAELRESLEPARRDGRVIGFVPTMGALHEGHLSLVRAARSECDLVVMSIFVNPLQFGPSEDLGAYPRDEANDLKLAEQEKVDVTFLPSVQEMYPEAFATTVKVGPLGEVLEGAARPGHFDGVATVVAKLFNVVQPQRAYFGQKDAQQVAVVERLVANLSYPIEVRICPTVRAPDGLALSSRNAYLSRAEREKATVLWRALQAGRDAWIQDRDPRAAERAMEKALASQPSVAPDYHRAVDPKTFEAPGPGGPVLLAVAARLGNARLIDNLLVGTTELQDERGER